MYSKETRNNVGLSQGSSQETIATTTNSVAQGNPPTSQVDVMDVSQGKEDEDVEMEKDQATLKMESFVVGDV
ncbi:hypothetical protein JHK85_052974 [Glycine max]|nr:hypothetical protein JHK85_052974 [Glycine max]